MRFEETVDVDAVPAAVFAVYADVERWSDWTASVTKVERLDDGAFGVGSRAKVHQPKLPVATWTVTDLQPGRAFTWVATGPGLRTTGTHLVEPSGHGARVTATLDQEGPLGWLVGRLTAGLTRRYLVLETEGIKRRCEASGGQA